MPESRLQKTREAYQETSAVYRVRHAEIRVIPDCAHVYVYDPASYYYRCQKCGLLTVGISTLRLRTSPLPPVKDANGA